MNVLDLLIRKYVPLWGDNRATPHPFHVQLRSPSRASMLTLDRLTMDRAQLAREQLARSVKESAEGLTDEAAERAAKTDLEAMQKESDRALQVRRDFIADHLVEVVGLEIPEEAWDHSGLDPKVGLKGFVMAQNGLMLELERELKRRGTLPGGEAKS